MIETIIFAFAIITICYFVIQFNKRTAEDLQSEIIAINDNKTQKQDIMKIRREYLETKYPLAKELPRLFENMKGGLKNMADNMNNHNDQVFGQQNNVVRINPRVLENRSQRRFNPENPKIRIDESDYKYGQDFKERYLKPKKFKICDPINNMPDL